MFVTKLHATLANFSLLTLGPVQFPLNVEQKAMLTTFIFGIRAAAFEGKPNVSPHVFVANNGTGIFENMGLPFRKILKNSANFQHPQFTPKVLRKALSTFGQTHEDPAVRAQGPQAMNHSPAVSLTLL